MSVFGVEHVSIRHVNFSTLLLQIQVESAARDYVHVKTIGEFQARAMNLGVFRRQKVFKSMSLDGRKCRQNREDIRGLNPRKPNMWRSEDQDEASKGTETEQPWRCEETRECAVMKAKGRNCFR